MQIETGVDDFSWAFWTVDRVRVLQHSAAQTFPRKQKSTAALQSRHC
jgi:hypothetical protein